MKKALSGILIILFVLGTYYYFDGLVIGYKNDHFVVLSYRYDCADYCVNVSPSWSKKYYGEISYNQCVGIGGSPIVAGLVTYNSNGEPDPTRSIGGYKGCRPD